MNHRRHNEGKAVFAERKCISFAYNDSVFGKVRAEEVFHHSEGFCGCDHGSAGINLKEAVYISRMVRLHMLDYKIIRFSSVESSVEIIQPFVREVCVDGIHYGDFFVEDNVRIIRYSVGYRILTFKYVYFAVVNAYISDTA